MRKFKQLIGMSLALSALFLTSCSSDDDNFQPEPEPTGEFQHGIFVLNEGNFGAGNASVSFLSKDGMVTNDIFGQVNNEALGDVAQSIYLEGDLAYIIVNGSGKIEVVNRYTFEKQASISTGLINPRHLTIHDGKAYVTNWGDPANPDDDYVAVVNLSNYTIETTIPVTEGPEQIITINDKLFVAQMGGWGYGNSISVIQPGSQTVSANIPVADVPSSIAADGDVLIVMSSGKAAWTGDETQGALTAIDTHNNHILSSTAFAAGSHPNKMAVSGNSLFYTIDDQVYKTGVNPSSWNSTGLLFSTSVEGTFGAYSFAVRNGFIYIGDAGDYTSDGRVLIYKDSGSFMGSYTVGPLPNSFGFND